MNDYKEAEFYEMLERFFPDNEKKIKGISTMLGTSAILVMFLMKFSKQFTVPLPRDVILACGITSQNMVAITSALNPCDVVTYPLLENLSEQDFEDVYRNMKGAIQAICEQIKQSESLC